MRGGCTAAHARRSLAGALDAFDGEMTVSASGVIDFVAHDPTRDEVLLVLVEERSWGDAGCLLPDLQEKLNVYLNYVETGQLERAFPDLGGKRINVRLHSSEAPGERELEFLEIVTRKVFRPRHMRMTWRVIGQQLEYEYECANDQDPCSLTKRLTTG